MSGTAHVRYQPGGGHSVAGGDGAAGDSHVYSVLLKVWWYFLSSFLLDLYYE